MAEFRLEIVCQFASSWWGVATYNVRFITYKDCRLTRFLEWSNRCKITGSSRGYLHLTIILQDVCQLLQWFVHLWIEFSGAHAEPLTDVPEVIVLCTHYDKRKLVWCVCSGLVWTDANRCSLDWPNVSSNTSLRHFSICQWPLVEKGHFTMKWRVSGLWCSKSPLSRVQVIWFV